MKASDLIEWVHDHPKVLLGLPIVLLIVLFFLAAIATAPDQFGLYIAICIVGTLIGIAGIVVGVVTMYQDRSGEQHEKVDTED